MLLSTSCPLAFRWPERAPRLRLLSVGRGNGLHPCPLQSHTQRVCTRHGAVTKFCGQHLGLSHAGRPASARCRLLLFPVFAKDPKTLEKSEVSPFQIARAWLHALRWVACRVRVTSLNGSRVHVLPLLQGCRLNTHPVPRRLLCRVSIMQEVPEWVLRAERTDSHLDDGAVYRVSTW